jgi:membrane-bound lytic murein transglycosylase D
VQEGDRTVAVDRGSWRSGRLLRVCLDDGREFRFARTFSIGRGADCDVRIDDPEVSRKHVVVSCANGRWSLQDQSRNGVFADGQRVPVAPIGDSLTVSLGEGGPSVTLEVMSAATGIQRPPDQPAEPEPEIVDVDRYAERYFGGSDDSEPVGHQTMMIRKAFDKVKRENRRKNNLIVAAASVLTLAAAGYAYYNHLQLARLRALTQDEFYAIKAKDVLIADLEERARGGDRSAASERARLQAERLAQVRKNEAALNELVYKDLNETDRLILRVTRRFGECELAAPPGYLARVKSYISQWQSTGRFANDLARAQQNGYINRIAEEMLKHNLPPDFFYLAMQESDFNPGAVGPWTKYGHAKGMWQFIPETARRFGLRTGPLVNYPRPDADDERQDWNKATTAAALYIKELYTTDAQASGLLVMASYNWGEHRIIDRVRELASNPRDRNFWKLIERFRIPGETYNYVFNIVAAAVIGENPRAFGFDFDNPLAGAQQRYDAGL